MGLEVADVTTIYVKEQGAYVKKSGGRLVITKDEKTLLEFPVIRLENLVLLGNVQVSTQALHMLFESGADVSYLTCNGRCMGHARSESSKNIFLKMAQFEKYKDRDFKAAMMRSIVRGKIKNQINIIRRHNWGSEDEDWKEKTVKMGELLAELDRKDDNSGIMGIEGICSSIYFNCFSKMLKTCLEFTKRVKRPATDPVNALLSLGYVFLTNEMDSLLESNSFETCLGFLHGVKYGRKSLSLDMVEEFRQPLVDRLVLYLLNKRIITESDFEQRDECSYYLTESGFSVFCSQYEEFIEKPFGNGREDIRDMMKNQVKKLKESVMEGKEYQSFVMEL